jgi:PTH1 family peptidyl-tRNA hydrolase
MWLIVGLGNPGAEYAATRHNIGFLAVRRMAPAGVNFSNKFHGEFAQTTLGSESLLLLLPQTFMNLSGKSVQAALAFYKLPPSQLVVIYDEVDLPLGKLRIKRGGGANGHNGIKDIDRAIGQDYWRIRLGVGRPPAGHDTADYVLSRFGSDEAPLLAKTLGTLAEHLPLFWQHSPEKLMSAMAETMQQPKPAVSS